MPIKTNIDHHDDDDDDDDDDDKEDDVVRENKVNATLMTTK